MQTTKQTVADLRALAEGLESGRIEGVTGINGTAFCAAGSYRGRIVLLTDIPAALEPGQQFISELITNLSSTPEAVPDEARQSAADQTTPPGVNAPEATPEGLAAGAGVPLDPPDHSAKAGGIAHLDNADEQRRDTIPGEKPEPGNGETVEGGDALGNSTSGPGGGDPPPAPSDPAKDAESPPMNVEA